MACALIAATFYGLNIPFARLASFAGVSGATLVFYRVLLMLAVVLAFVLVTRRSIAVAPSERATIVVLGLVTTLVGICYISSVSFVPVAVAVALFYTFPVVIVLASQTPKTPVRRPARPFARLQFQLVSRPQPVSWSMIAFPTRPTSRSTPLRSDCFRTSTRRSISTSRP